MVSADVSVIPILLPSDGSWMRIIRCGGDRNAWSGAGFPFGTCSRRRGHRPAPRCEDFTTRSSVHNTALCSKTGVVNAKSSREDFTTRRRGSGSGSEARVPPGMALSQAPWMAGRWHTPPAFRQEGRGPRAHVAARASAPRPAVRN